MDVTNSNFEELLETVKKDIEECTFASFDTELTGLYVDGKNPKGVYPPSGYYHHYFEYAKCFIPIQFGLSLFRQNSTDGSYSCKSYNFYVFPYRERMDSFAVQPSAVDYLLNNKFDFSKVFKEGICYIREEERDLVKKNFLKRIYFDKNMNQKVVSSVTSDEVKRADEICAKILSVLEDGPDSVKIPNVDQRTRQLVFSALKKCKKSSRINLYHDGGCLVSKTRKQSLDEVVLEGYGFSRVIIALTQSKKLIVGHNCFLDICHIVNNFLTELQDDYLEFKETVHTLFPYIIDTKYMSSCKDFKDTIPSTVLCNLFEILSKPPFQPIPKIDSETGYGYDIDSDSYHEAGFDAYICGLCFISLLNSRASVSKRNKPNNVLIMSGTDSFNEALSEYMNRINLLGHLDSYCFFGGKDPEYDRSNVFHAEFPEEWSRKDLKQFFTATTGAVVRDMFWISSTSAWVIAFVSEKYKPSFKKLISSKKKIGSVILTPFHEAYPPDSKNQTKKRINVDVCEEEILKKRRNVTKDSLKGEWVSQMEKEADDQNPLFKADDEWG